MKIALIQANLVWENKAKNLSNFNNILNNIPEKVEAIFLPEMFNTGFTMHTENFAETMEGSTVDWLKEISLKSNLLIAGSIIVNDQHNYYNRLLVANQGEIIHFYDKRHLFRMANEDAHFTEGVKRESLFWGNIKWRFQICYDLRFPVWSRNDDDFEILVYVANWPEKRIKQWHRLLKARAIENQCFVVGVNRIGVDGNGIAYSGGSVVYDFLGETVVACNHKEEVLIADIDIQSLFEYKNTFPAWKDRDKFNITFE